MGVYIKDMEMPKSCDTCRFFVDAWCYAISNEDWRNAYNKPPSGKRLKNCPLEGRPKGHWIRHEHGFWTFVNDKGERGGWIPDYECNLCGSRGWEYAMNFCPNCGARMKGADDED